MGNPRKRALRKGRQNWPDSNVNNNTGVITENVVEPEIVENNNDIVEVVENIVSNVNENNEENITTNDLILLKKSALITLAIEKLNISEIKAKKLTKNKLVEALLETT